MNAIAKKLRIPVIGVATSGIVDGAELVIFVLLGFLPPEAMSKHSKAYASSLMDDIKAFACFDAEISRRPIRSLRTAGIWKIASLKNP